MKSRITVVLGLVLFLSTLTFLNLTNATEKNIISDAFTAVSITDSVWITPTGVAIPAEFRNDWEGHIAVAGKKYTTLYCPEVNNQKHIKCIKGTPDDCTKAFDCLPCINCN